MGRRSQALMKAGGARIRDALASRIRSGGATVMPLSTSFRSALDMSIESKKKRGEGRCLRGEFGGRGLAGILCSLLGAGFPVIDGYRWRGIDVDEVRTLASSPSSPSPPSPLFLSSPSWFLSLPRPSFRAALAPRDRPGASFGACSPGRQHSRGLACERVCGRVRGRYATPCRLRVSGVAWFRCCGSWWIVVVWLMVVVVRRK